MGCEQSNPDSENEGHRNEHGQDRRRKEELRNEHGQDRRRKEEPRNGPGHHGRNKVRNEEPRNVPPENDRRMHRGQNSPHQRGQNSPHQRGQKNAQPIAEDDSEMFSAFINGTPADQMINKGTPLETIVDKSVQSHSFQDMKDIRDENSIFMIKPFRHDPSGRKREPKPNNDTMDYTDLWDEDHLRMPCSPNYISRKKKSMWSVTCQSLIQLKEKCGYRAANVEVLKTTIETCSARHIDMGSLETLITKVYSKEQRDHFMSTVLSNICNLALTVDSTCGQPPPLLKINSNRSVTMSQRQAASLLACAFFCLFPYRSGEARTTEYENYQDPNFDRLYHTGPPMKIEKLKCIFHYFTRITENMPNGVITFQRFALPKSRYPLWHESKTPLGKMHLTTGRKIEEVENVLQVDFANKYIGGGVLGSGCVQEEIRFTICPEMLVSLLVCEVMEENECVFLIGCEQFSSYKGYAESFKFAGEHNDNTPKDNWGRKWTHLVAMDAIYFRHPSTQYEMKNIMRELLKAYTCFRPLDNGPNYEFAIATGNWGCGAFNGDRQLKAIIQLMAASEAKRPLIYAAFGDKKLVKGFSTVYEYLTKVRATVGDLHWYLNQYSSERIQYPLFDYILNTPPPNIKSSL